MLIDGTKSGVVLCSADDVVITGVIVGISISGNEVMRAEVWLSRIGGDMDT